MKASGARMAHEATSSAPAEALRAAWRAFAWSRLGILAVAVYTGLTTSAAGGLTAANARRFDEPALTHPLGGFGDAVLSPLAHWDAVWFLNIAGTGYVDADSPRTAFFPLYPLLTRALGELGGGGRGALLIAAYAVSLGALMGALYLLHRLVELELGRELAAPTLLLVCVFPASFFFGAPYSESLFLLASVGAFYAARTGNWAWAGAAGAAASATRSAGFVLLMPLVLLYLYGPRADREPDRAPAGSGWLDGLRPRYAIRPGAAWLALAPAGVAAYAVYLGVDHGDAFGFVSAQDAWSREFAGPFSGVWQGAVAAFDGARQVLSGSRDHVYFTQAAGDPFRIAAINLMLFATLCFAAVASVGVLRRLPFAYGAYVVAALAVPLSYPVDPQPLMSLPRFVAVLFPLFMWLALVCRERGLLERVAAASAVGLGVLVTQFVSWYFVA
jgi:mannosyltransferase PIG-V